LILPGEGSFGVGDAGFSLKLSGGIEEKMHFQTLQKLKIIRV
jgi:hypothetical protein